MEAQKTKEKGKKIKFQALVFQFTISTEVRTIFFPDRCQTIKNRRFKSSNFLSISHTFSLNKNREEATEDKISNFFFLFPHFLGKQEKIRSHRTRNSEPIWCHKQQPSQLSEPTTEKTDMIPYPFSTLS